MERFSLKSYRIILEAAIEAGFSFVPFTENVLESGQIFLRHDVDFSLEMALDLARINAAMGISGTFFVLLRSQVYNLLSEESLDCIDQILILGQNLGFHATFPKMVQPEATIYDLARRLHEDFSIIKRNVEGLTPVFSWHNPSGKVLDLSRDEQSIAGLLNVYSDLFTEDITYMSDSNLRNRPADFKVSIESGAHRSMQLLFHPVNWVVGGESMSEILANAWVRVVQEREYDVRKNRVYANVFPLGMPGSLLTAFADEFRQAFDAGAAISEHGE